MNEEMYIKILLRMYIATSYSLSLLSKGKEKFDNVTDVVSDFWSAIATHRAKTDYHLHFDKIAVHGTFSD